MNSDIQTIYEQNENKEVPKATARLLDILYPTADSAQNHVPPIALTSISRTQLMQQPKLIIGQSILVTIKANKPTQGISYPDS